MKNLTAYNDQNAREIEMMMGKAMCAYANAVTINKMNPKSENVIALMSEYEATVRCIDMFVRENIYEIQLAVIDSAKEEFGI